MPLQSNLSQPSKTPKASSQLKSPNFSSTTVNAISPAATQQTGSQQTNEHACQRLFMDAKQRRNRKDRLKNSEAMQNEQIQSKEGQKCKKGDRASSRLFQDAQTKIKQKQMEHHLESGSRNHHQRGLSPQTTPNQSRVKQRSKSPISNENQNEEQSQSQQQTKDGIVQESKSMLDIQFETLTPVNEEAQQNSEQENQQKLQVPLNTLDQTQNESYNQSGGSQIFSSIPPDSTEHTIPPCFPESFDCLNSPNDQPEPIFVSPLQQMETIDNTANAGNATTPQTPKQKQQLLPTLPLTLKDSGQPTESIHECDQPQPSTGNISSKSVQDLDQKFETNRELSQKQEQDQLSKELNEGQSNEIGQLETNNYSFEAPCVSIKDLQEQDDNQLENDQLEVLDRVLTPLETNQSQNNIQKKQHDLLIQEPAQNQTNLQSHNNQMSQSQSQQQFELPFLSDIQGSLIFDNFLNQSDSLCNDQSTIMLQYLEKILKQQEDIMKFHESFRNQMPPSEQPAFSDTLDKNQNDEQQ